MTRRQFAFWLGLGLFTVADKLRVYALDDLAAAAMKATEPNPATTPPADELLAEEPPVHWTVVEEGSSRWFERETFLEGKWKATGRTTPVNKQTGKPKSDGGDYLDDGLVPAELRQGVQTEAFELPPRINAVFEQHPATEERKSRHGRPPSKWLRSLDAEELRIWMKTIKVPPAGVSGMTYWVHLTRDHSFDPVQIEGLTTDEQAKLHAAAHFGY